MFNRTKPSLGARQKWAHPLSRGLVGHWLFNEGGGTKALDIAKGNMGTLTNGVLWSSSIFGKTLSFDGVDDYIAIPYSTAITPVNITVSLWIQLSTTPVALDTIISRKYDGTGIPFLFDMRGGGNTNPTFGTYTGSNHFVISATALTIGSWYHVVGTFDGAAYKIYINGVLDNTLTDSTALYTGSSLPMDIGALDLTGTPGRFFKGKVNDVRIYNRALSTQEIRKLYTDPFADVRSPRAIGAMSVAPPPPSTNKTYAYVFG